MVFFSLNLKGPASAKDVTLKIVGKITKLDLTSAANLKKHYLDLVVGTGFNTQCHVLVSQSLRFVARVNLISQTVNGLKQG